MTDLDARLAVQGSVEPGFEGVRDVFAANFAQGLEIGAAYSVYHQGRRVVDLWGGVADQATGRPWEQDTLILVFSTTKGATATCANLLAQRGLLDVDAPVVRYWPEFAQAGKEGVTVNHLLSHRAGLAWADCELTLEEVCRWDPIVEALAAEPTHWEPGTAHGYHATTYGWLVGEVVRRIDGRSLGRFFHEEVATPLGLDFHIGLPEADEGRVAPLVPFTLPEIEGVELPPGLDPFEAMGVLLGPESTMLKALGTPRGAFANFGVFNSRAVRAAEIPAANGVTDARSVARLYAGLVGEVDGVRVLGADQLADATTQRTEGPDIILMDMDLQHGLGYMVQSAMIAPGAAHGAAHGFGHFGMGGSAGWGDPDAGLGMGYVMNRMDMGLTGDLRSANLIDATYEAAGRIGA